MTRSWLNSLKEDRHPQSARRNSMALNLFFPVLFSILLALSSGESFSIKGYHLHGYELGNNIETDWLGCINHCNANVDCISYNFNLREEFCQLNKMGIDVQTYVNDRTLSYDDDFVFHQLKIPRSDQLASPRADCSCACGSDQHCHVKPLEPGIGDTEDKPAPSCKAILAKRSGVESGAYYLATLPMTQVYCHMTELPGCDGGGWSLVMKIDGNKDTFQYNSSHWTSKKMFNVQDGTNLDERETLLPSYWSLKANKVCLGMKSNGVTSYISIDNNGTFLHTAVEKAAKLPKQTWKSLLTNSSMQSQCTLQGFSVQESSSHAVRIGVLGYSKSDCGKGFSQSLLGFGISDPSLSCGNKASGSNSDNGARSIAAFGYIFVQ